MRDVKRRGEDTPLPGLGRGELPLPDPFPEYLTCPVCGEPEVEVWCYEDGARCHACGAWVQHTPDCAAPSEDDSQRG